ncbi:N-acetyltransferase family protein [Cellulomonas sp. 179-A 4D5 NHS]|uniref:GNAT family N-acetyltransferase n=1 Tax=Cellulomonas sp. 179-A 4D5 NHS TaxID=3142378 RepID=UPI0039A140C4
MSTVSLAPIAVRAAAPAQPPLPPAELGLAWRPLVPEDAPALFGLVAAIEEGDALPFRRSLEEVVEMFEGDWKDHASDTLVGLDGDGVMRAYAQATTAPGDESLVRAFLLGGVHPEWRGRGVGRAVVAWLEGRGRQLLAGSGKDVPGRLAAYLEDAAPAATRVYARAGFAPIRYYSEMRRPLRDGVPDVPQVDGVSIVPWSPELDEATRVAHNEAFADHWGSQPRSAEAWSHGRSMFAPSWSFLAVDDATGEVAGYLLSGRYEQDWAVAGYPSGYTELLGVRRAWRGRGLGVALLTAAMHAYAADGMHYAELGVDTENPSGAHGLYASLGYEVFQGSSMWSIEL